MREEYPRWGKDKLVILLHRDGFDCSASMVGRILHKLKERGILKEPVSNYISARERRWQRPNLTETSANIPCAHTSSSNWSSSSLLRSSWWRSEGGSR
ncbi:hypothetical protein ACFLVS_03115 [Chloroflexota bacterium]